MIFFGFVWLSCNEGLDEFVSLLKNDAIYWLIIIRIWNQFFIMKRFVLIIIIRSIIQSMYGDFSIRNIPFLCFFTPRICSWSFSSICIFNWIYFYVSFRIYFFLFDGISRLSRFWKMAVLSCLSWAGDQPAEITKNVYRTTIIFPWCSVSRWH